MAATETRFVFRGNAVGAGGYVHGPENLIIAVQGASSLPVIGGYSRSTVGAVKFSNVLSLSSVRTEANGDFSEQENAYKTLANSVVKGIDITGRLTADALQATLTSTHPASGGEPTIVPTGTQIINLRLDGYPVTVTLDLKMFTKYGTLESLSNAYTADDAFYKKFGHRFFGPQPPQKKGTPRKRQIPVSAGYVVCSIVSEIKTNHPKAVVDGHIITLKGFGRIFLGELLITSASRRLTLLRVRLGPSTAKTAKAPAELEGEVVCVDVESNGGVIF